MREELDFTTSPDRDWYFPGAENPLQVGDKLAAIIVDASDVRVVDEDFGFGKGVNLEVLEVRWPWMMKVSVMGSDDTMNGEKWSYGRRDSDLFWQDNQWNILIWGKQRAVMVAKLSESETGSELSS